MIRNLVFYSKVENVNFMVLDKYFVIYCIIKLEYLTKIYKS